MEITSIFKYKINENDLIILIMYIVYMIHFLIILNNVLIFIFLFMLII